jgi:hypothetical protein
MLLLAVLVVGFPRVAFAQVVELELGAGYVVGGGAENPGPSLVPGRTFSTKSRGNAGKKRRTSVAVLSAIV